MASIYRHGPKWRAQVYVQGTRDSGVFETKAEAARWALRREAELSGRRLPDRTFAEAMERYAADVAPSHRGSRWELLRLKSLAKEPIARRYLAALDADDFTAWRDARLAERKPGTVAREMNLVRSVLEHARLDLRWLRSNPMADVRWPKTPPGRRRRITPAEVEAVAKAFGVDGVLRADTARARVGLAFLFALETAMRSGEIVGMRWQDVHLEERYVELQRTKNGDAREVPLSKRAVDILRALPRGEGPVFGLTAEIRDAIWRKHRPQALDDLHFHDSRAEAIWRLSKRLDVLQLARMIGHRDIKSLMFYYHESAKDMAKRLG